MVDDILLSPEEQDERARQWLKDNALALIVGVVLGLGAVFGYNTYQAKLKTDAEQASVLYDAVMNAIAQSDVADIEDQVTTLKKDHAGTSYAAKAALLRARQHAISDLDAALLELQWVSEHANELGLQHTAHIRQAKILIAQGNLEAAEAVASRKSYDGFDTHYHEILGDIAMQRESFAAARVHYQAAIDGIGAADTGYTSILTLKMNRLPTEHEPDKDTSSDAIVE